MNAVLQGLIGNLSFVAVLMMIWARHRQFVEARLRLHSGVSLGAALGLGAVASMMLAVEFAPGAYCDLRSSLIMIAALFGGPLAAGLSAFMAAAFRLWLGGTSALNGAIGIVGVSGIGLGAFLLLRGRASSISTVIAAAAAAVVLSLVLMFTLPNGQARHVFWTIGLPTVVFNFISSVVCGLVLLRFNKLRTNSEILSAALSQMPDFHYVKNTRSQFVLANENVAKVNGLAHPKQLVGLSDFDLAPTSHAEALFRKEQDIMMTGVPLHQHEEALVARDGTQRWFSSSKVPLKDPRGSVIGLAGVTREITHQKILELEVEQSRALLSRAMSQMTDGLALFDRQGFLVFCNEQYGDAFPLSKTARKPGAHITDILKAVAESGERRDIAQDDVDRWVQVSAEKLFTDDDEEIELVGDRWIQLRRRVATDGTALVIVSDITAVKHQERTLRDLATHMQDLANTDSLTGLYNRRAFDAAIEPERERSMRSGAPLSLMLIDIDHFKQFNDRYGHQAGDACLVNVAKCLRKVAKRPMDIIARFGGEEFVILLPSTDVEDTVRLADELREILKRRKIKHDGSPFGFVTASVGVATMAGTYPFYSTKDLIQKADEALYQAKQQGRDRSVTATAQASIMKAV